MGAEFLDIKQFSGVLHLFCLGTSILYVCALTCSLRLLVEGSSTLLTGIVVTFVLHNHRAENFITNFWKDVHK